MRCTPTLAVMLMLGASFWGVSLAYAAQPEVPPPQAEAQKIQPAQRNATAPATAANAPVPNALITPTVNQATGNATTTAPGSSFTEKAPAAQPTVTPSANATAARKNATSRAPSATPSTPARPAAKPATNGTAQHNALAQRNATLKQPAREGNATQTKAPLAQNGTMGATGEKEGWIVVEQGTRPVYVGIHGGTVPLTVLRASNGALFALAGETGSDFMNVLRGNTTGTGRGAAAQAAQQEEEKITEQSNGEAPLTLLPETKTQQATSALQEQPENKLLGKLEQERLGKEQNSTLQAKVLQAPPSVAAMNSTSPASTPTGKPAPSSALPVPPVTTAKVPTPALKAESSSPAAERDAQQKKTATQAPPAAAEQTPSANVAAAQKMEEKQPPKDPMVAKLLGVPPPESDLVIASSDLAHRLKNANADLAPFGLTADFVEQEDEEQIPVPKPKPAASLPKLTLGSYKDVLQLR